MSNGGWFDREAIESERLDADREQAELEAAGRDVGRGLRVMRRLRAAGKLAEAAQACPHGWGFPLDSIAARDSHDARAGQQGFRCNHCGSVLAKWNGLVVYPCERGAA